MSAKSSTKPIEAYLAYIRRRFSIRECGTDRVLYVHSEEVYGWDDAVRIARKKADKENWRIS